MSNANDQAANIRGTAWMIAAMAGFAIEDALIKVISQPLPMGQIMMMFGIGGTALFAVYATSQNDRLFVPDVLSRPMRIRVLFEVVGRLFYFLALAAVPLSVATVILQATPIVVVAGAAVVFGETVGWRRWTAIIIGLIGVIVIVQPGTDQFSALSILAIIGMLGFAGRDLASRAAPATLSTTLLGFYGFLTVALAGAAFAVWEGVAFVRMSSALSLYLLGAIIVGVGAYSCLMKAMRTGEVSSVTPFRYTRLLFGITLGVVIFGEALTIEMVIGSGLIVLSGLFILWKGKRASALT